MANWKLYNLAQRDKVIQNSKFKVDPNERDLQSKSSKTRGLLSEAKQAERVIGKLPSWVAEEIIFPTPSSK